MITYDEKARIFQLDSAGSSYVLGIYRENYLVHLYYGTKLPLGNPQQFWPGLYRGKFDSMSPLNDRVGDPLFSVDINPMEYGTNGAGDFRISALSVQGTPGNTVTDIRYVSHKIYGGKPALAGLPATFAKEDEAQTLELETVDPVTGVKVFLVYTVFAQHPVITRSVRVEAPESGEIATLHRAYSACVDLPTMELDMVHLYGKWAKENTLERQPLHHGIQSIHSKRGMTGANHNPFVVLAEPNADEDRGRVYGFHLVYSGNFAFDLEADTRGCTRVLLGINPTDFSWEVTPAEPFTSPEAVLVYSQEGLGGMSRALHRFYRQHLIRGEWAHKKRPLLINSWEAAYFDFDDDKLVEFAKSAKELGMELLVMDDGWFGNRCDDHRALGDWTVNEEKLKGGLGSLISRVNALGVEFGIWYEPEMISPDSDLYRAHPDWVVCAPGREKSLSRYQCVLDFTRREVREYIFTQMEEVLSNHNIIYVKWDCNRHISEAASLTLPPHRQGEFFHRYVLGVYELMDRVTKAHPHILLENCSSGGGRFDPGMLYYAPQIWASDNTDAIERLTIQFGASLCTPISALGAHVSGHSRTPLKTRGDVAMCGTFGYELDPRTLTQEEAQEVRAQIASYHQYYDLIRTGDFYRLTNPNLNPFLAEWLFVSPDKKEALFTQVTMRQRENITHFCPLRGLDPQRMYEVEETGECYSGTLLMELGLNLSGTEYPNGDGLSLTRHLVARFY